MRLGTWLSFLTWRLHIPVEDLDCVALSPRWKTITRQSLSQVSAEVLSLTQPTFHLVSNLFLSRTGRGSYIHFQQCAMRDSNFHMKEQTRSMKR